MFRRRHVFPLAQIEDIARWADGIARHAGVSGPPGRPSAAYDPGGVFHTYLRPP